MRVWKTLSVSLAIVATAAMPALGQSGKKATTGAATSASSAAASAAPAPSAAPAATASGAPATPTSTGTSSKPAPATTAAVDGATYAVRLRDLETRIDELKEQIRRSHTRLSLLSDTILAGGVGGARAEIEFDNEMSNAFRVVRVLVVLDGAVQYNKQDDTGALAAQQQIPVFSGAIPPGDHTVQVLVQLRGHGYGVFSYLRGYRFEVKSSHSFTVSEGKTLKLTAAVYEKGGVTTPLEQRPAIRFIEKVRAGADTGEGSPTAPKAAGGASTSGSGASGGFSIGAGGK
jgi:hypothetical protein